MTDPTRPATGYPAQPPQNGYPAHQPQQPYFYTNHNPYHAQPYQQPPPRATFFRRFFAALIAVFIIFGTVLLIIWLILRPKIPTFSLLTLSLSNLNTTTNSISAIWTSQFTVSNPNNKLHVYYDEIEARLFYHSSFVAQNQLPPFDQATKTQSQMDAKLVADSAYLGPKLVGELKTERESSGKVRFDMQVLAIVRFKAGGWRARRRFLRVFCDHLEVKIDGKGNNGTLSNGPVRCAVGI